MPQLINLFLVILGVIACGVGLARFQQHPASLLALVLGAAVVALAYFSDRRRQRRVDERKRAAMQDRVEELTRRSWGPGASLQVPGSVRFVMLGFSLAAVGAGSLYMGAIAAQHDVMLIVIGMGFLLLATLVLPRALAGIGHPVLELTAAGFATPLNGRIAWREVSGIFLSAISQRGGTPSFSLMFRVKQFARVAPRIHWTDHLLAAFRLGALARGVVTVALPASMEKPEAVCAVARLLWKQATGNDYDWNPRMSEQFNEASKRIGTLAAHYQEPGAIEHSLANPHKALEEMEQANRDMTLIAGEQKRQLAKSRWMVGFIVLLLLGRMAWPWIGPLLHR